MTPLELDSKTPAPHETAAVLRLHRLGWSAPQICSQFDISKRQLIHELNLAIDDEAEAQRTGAEIYDGTIEGVDATEQDAKPTRNIRAKLVAVGDLVVSYNSPVKRIRTDMQGDFIFTLEDDRELKFRPLDELIVR